MAIRSAYTESGVAVLIVPDDLFAVKQKNSQSLTVSGYSQPKTLPDQSSISSAVQLLENAEKPVILAGRGAKGSSEELIDFAESMKAPIVLSLLGKGTIPDYHELNLGQHGQIGTKPAFEAIMETDLLLLIGTTFPYRGFLPKNAKAIQIGLNPKKIGNYYPISQGLCGDAKKILPMLTTRVPGKDQSSFLTKMQEKMKKWHIHMQEEKRVKQNPIQAPQVMYELENVVKKDAVISADVGNVTVGDGYRVETISDLTNLLEQAFTSNKPAIVDVAIEDMAPLPGIITYDQAVSYGEYLIKEFFTNNKVEFPVMKKTLRRL